MGGHSRAVAALALEACGPRAEAAALVHDLGPVAVPNTIWDKPGPLTRDEHDRAESAHARDRPTAPASALHRRTGRCRVRRPRARRRLWLPPAGRRRPPRSSPASIAAADCYQAMTRTARTGRTSGRRGCRRTAGHERSGRARRRGRGAGTGRRGSRRAARPPLPAGLTAREAEVLRLLALGLTTQQVADRLVISAKTADHHVQHIYTKIGVSIRGAAALIRHRTGDPRHRCLINRSQAVVGQPELRPGTDRRALCFQCHRGCLIVRRCNSNSRSLCSAVNIMEAGLSRGWTIGVGSHHPAGYGVGVEASHAPSWLGGLCRQS